MAEQRKQELLGKLRPVIVKMTETTQALERCLTQSKQAGAFDVPAGVSAMQSVVQVQKDLNVLVQGYAADSGSGGRPFAYPPLFLLHPFSFPIFSSRICQLKIYQIKNLLFFLIGGVLGSSRSPRRLLSPSTRSFR